MSSEHRNRTNKAQAIAAALVTVGMPADGMLDEAGWRIAALAGWHIAKAEGVDGIAAEPWTTVSDATRTEVRRLLAADEARRAEDAEGLTAHRTDDVFASIAAGSALPRSAQDPDAAPAERCSGCGRPCVYDYETEAYRHTESPEVGCFLIRPEAPAPVRDDTDWAADDAQVDAILDDPIPAATEAAPCGDCGHDAGYHDSLLTTGEIVGPCYHDGCGCTAWAATARPSTAEWLAGINYGATTTEGWD